MWSGRSSKKLPCVKSYKITKINDKKMRKHKKNTPKEKKKMKSESAPSSGPVH
jgi:hypothetical protein